MPLVELSDRAVAKAKPPAGKRQEEYFDKVTTGLSLIASVSGVKTFFVHYTSPRDGKRTRMRLGQYPELTLAVARSKAREARAEIGEGSDPLVARRALEASQTVADLVESYIARHAAEKRSGKAIARRLRKNVTGVIGALRLADWHRRDVTKCIDAVKDRGAPVEANRTFEDLRAMVRWAKGRGDLEENLCDGMRKPSAMTPRERVLSADEIRTMWAALPITDMREGTRNVIRLCLITGQRVGEISGMSRDEIDFERGLWVIPPARSKNGREHSVPLPPMAINIICTQLDDAEALAMRKGRAAPSYVFAAPGGRAAMTGGAVAKAVRREEAALGVAAFTPHDLRRSMATHLEGLGCSPFVVGHLLNHVSMTKATTTSAVYARYDYGREKREALNLWAQHLAAIVAGQSGNVVPLHASVAS